MLRNKLYIATLGLLVCFGSFAQDANQAFSATFESRATIDLYPNPAVDFLTIEIKNQDLENVKFELRSIIGNQLLIQPESIGINTYRISLKEYSSGYYFLIVRDDAANFKKAFKFLKQ